METTRRRQLLRQLIRPAAVFIAALVICLVGVVVLTLEALEERQSAVAAADLRLAVMTVASVEDVEALDPAGRARFTVWLNALDVNVEPAVHALEEAEAEETRQQLNELSSRGQQALTSNVAVDRSDELTRFQPLVQSLRTASVSAADHASAAEQRAGVAAIGGVVLLGLAMGSALRTHTRAKSAELTAEAHRSAADRFGALLEEIPTATAVVGTDNAIAYASTSMTGLLGATPQQLADLEVLATPPERQALTEHIKLGGAERAALDVQSQMISDDNRSAREFRVRVSDLTGDPLVHGHLVSVSEITAENRSRRQLEYLAGHDQLTGLPNRRSMMAALDEGQPVSLLMIDLDGFKQTNDALGHGAGDELLIAVTGRFRHQLRADSDTRSAMYRLGGDEFAIVTDADLDEAEQLALRLLATLEQPIKLKVGFERAAASIGVARRDANGSQLSLLRRADIALYDAKHGGGGRIRVLDEELEATAVVAADVSRALETVSFDDEFGLAFQPIVNSQTHRVVLIEALARWISPTLGFIPPDQFIAISESSGRIVELGEWVLDQALATLSRLRSEGAALGTPMSVNVSPYQLMSGDFTELTKQRLAAHGLEPEDLVVELTESALVTNDGRTVEQLTALRELGCGVACDDFGSGYSNLGQLMRLPLSLLKVDRQLLISLSEMRDQAGGSSEQPCQVMGAIASIGAAIGVDVVAEGVETEAQAISLRDSGVGLLQGYFFSRPVDADTLLVSEILAGSEPEGAALGAD